MDQQQSAAQSDAALEFQTRAELYDWLAAQADELQLNDVDVKRNASGEIESVLLQGKSRDLLLAKLLGETGHFKLEGHEIALEPNGSDSGSGDIASSQQALTSGIPSSQTACSGSFCLTGRSWNDHYSLFGLGYHDVGGSASASGIVTSYSALIAPSTTCNTRIGCGPTNYYCQGDDRLVVTTVRVSYSDSQTIATCYHSVGYASVFNTYFSNMNNCGSGHCQDQPVAVLTGSSTATNSGASQSLTAFGFFKLPCTNGYGPAECYVDGVCSTQYAMGPGGSASTRTAAGSYDCQ